MTMEPLLPVLNNEPDSPTHLPSDKTSSSKIHSGRTCFAEDMAITPRAYTFEELLERELTSSQYQRVIKEEESYHEDISPSPSLPTPLPTWEDEPVSMDRVVVVERHLPDEHPSIVDNPFDLSEEASHETPSVMEDAQDSLTMEQTIQDQLNAMKQQHRASWNTLQQEKVQDLLEFEHMEKVITDMHHQTQLTSIPEEKTKADSLLEHISLEKQAILQEGQDIHHSTQEHDSQGWEAMASPISKHPKNMSNLFSEYDDTADLSYAIQDTSRVEQLNASSFFLSLDDESTIDKQHTYQKDSVLSVEAKESLQAKIVLLENTINNLKKDLANKDKMLMQSSKSQESKLLKERESFEQYRVQEISKIEEMKQEEIKKLRKERLAWEKQKKAADILPNKRERQELDMLRSQLSELVEEHRKKENRLVLAQDRLKKKVEVLSKRNQELEEEVKVLEISRAKFIEEKHQLQNKILSLKSNEPQNDKKLKRSVSSAAVGGLVGHAASVPSLPQKQISMPCLKVEKIQDSNMPDTKLNQQHPSFEPLNQLEKELKLDHTYQERVLVDGKTERLYPQGTRLVWYKNGTTKELNADGSFVIRFLNGDYKKVDIHQTAIYWFAETNTLQTAYADGLVIYQFESGQIEKSYPNGTLEILFPDGTVKLVHSNGQEESTFPDGTVQKVDCNGQRTIEFADGTKEYFMKGLKKRVHPDGTIKIVYPDGLQETRYVDGRIRVKDATGLILREA